MYSINRSCIQRTRGKYMYQLWTLTQTHERPPNSEYRENATTAPPKLQPCRILTRHGEHTSFPRETVPARKRGSHMSRHGKHNRPTMEPVHTRRQYYKQTLYAQHTHTLKESSTEFPTTGEGKFQHSGTSRLQPQCWCNHTCRNFQ